MSAPPIVDAVWGTRPRPPKRRLLWAAVLGVGAHAVLVALMWRAGPSLETWAADVAIRVHQEVVRVEAVTLEAHDEALKPEPEPEPVAPEPEPVAPEPTTAPEPVPTPEPEPAAEPVARRASTPRAKPAPAAAAEPLATEPEGPLDLSRDVVVKGSAETFAGGSTTTSGTSREPVRDPVAPGTSPPKRPPAGSPPASAPQTSRRRDRSASARPRDEDWSCPWPRAANALEIDKQSAIVRASLDARGRVLSVEVVDDPGHGFGAAAAECARRARFLPARDADGVEIPARTPPIRVRFTR